MSSLTTLFVVGPEEYVEFNESLGSKAFLEHVWDESVTPLKDGETADSRLRSAGARISSGPDPHIEFPTILRVKGKGNKYRPSGRWMTWDELHRQNPLAVSSPPSLDEFKKHGGQVGSGKKLKAGEWLAESKRVASVAKRHSARGEDNGSIANGAAQSVYAPRNCEASVEDSSSSGHVPALQSGWIGNRVDPSETTTPELREEDGWIGVDAMKTTPRQPPLANRSQSLAAKFRGNGNEAAAATPPPPPPPSERSLFQKFVSDVPSPETQLKSLPPTPQGPTTPARRRNVNLHIDPALSNSAAAIVAGNRSFDSTLVSPSTARTPLSATHPLPETPLKHTQNLPTAVTPARAGPGLAERRSQAPVTPLSAAKLASPAGAASQQDNLARGLGLGLTPTRATTFGGPLSPVQQRMTPPSRRLSRPLEETLNEVEVESDGANASAPMGLAVNLNDNSNHRRIAPAGKASDEIEAMLARLRSARSGFDSKGGNSGRVGSSASRWADPEVADQVEVDAPKSAAPAALASDAASIAPMQVASTLACSSSSSPPAPVVPPTPALGSHSDDDGDEESGATFAGPLESSAGGGSLLSRLSAAPTCSPLDSSNDATSTALAAPSADRSADISNTSNTSATTNASGGSSNKRDNGKKLTTRERRQRAKERRKEQQQHEENLAHNAPSQPRRGSVFKEQFSVKNAVEASATTNATLATLAPPTEPRAMRRGSSASASSSSRGGSTRRGSGAARSVSSSSSAVGGGVGDDNDEHNDDGKKDVVEAEDAVPGPADESTSTIAGTAAVAADDPQDASMVANPSHSRETSFSSSTSTHFDWAADDDDEDELPDLDDWGITLPPVSSSSVSSDLSAPGGSGGGGGGGGGEKGAGRQPPTQPRSQQQRGGGGKQGGAAKTTTATAAERRVPYWERQAANQSQQQQRPVRELFPRAGGASHDAQPAKRSANKNEGKELFGNTTTSTTGGGSSAKPQSQRRELFPTMTVNGGGNGSAEKQKTSAAAPPAHALSSNSKMLRIAGTASAATNDKNGNENSSKKALGSPPASAATPASKKNNVSIAGAAAAAAADANPSRRELMSGTVHSMHAPPPNNNNGGDDDGESAATNAPRRRGKVPSAAAGPGGNNGAFARLTGGIVGASAASDYKRRDGAGGDAGHQTGGSSRGKQRRGGSGSGGSQHTRKEQRAGV